MVEKKLVDNLDMYRGVPDARSALHRAVGNGIFRLRLPKLHAGGHRAAAIPGGPGAPGCPAACPGSQHGCPAPTGRGRVPQTRSRRKCVTCCFAVWSQTVFVPIFWLAGILLRPAHACSTPFVLLCCAALKVLPLQLNVLSPGFAGGAPTGHHLLARGRKLCRVVHA